tara:strand:+ start:2805 stop:4088 length:1284 start_codon:yes stop_codon:yes gene_type:complete
MIKKINYSFIHKSFIIFLFLLFTEGILRKWFTNSFSIELILLRDSIIIVTIVYAVRSNILVFTEKLEKILLLITLLIIFWSFLQLIITQTTLTISLIGLRNWLIFYWFVVIFYKSLDYEDLGLILKLLTITFIPIVILAYIQFISPIDSVVNKAVDGGFIFQVVDGIVRPSSIFTFTYGYNQYLAFVAPIILGLISLKDKFKISSKIKLLLLFFLLFAVLTCGSRSIIIYSAFLFATYFYLNLFNFNSVSINISKILMLIISIFLIINFLNDYFEIIFSRFETAAVQEDVFSRVMHMVFGAQNTWRNYSIFGEGLGAASNMARPFLNTRNFYLGEFDSDRILNEGGALGILFLCLKPIFIIILFSKCNKIKLISYERYIFSILILIFLVYQLTLSSITGQVASHAFFILGLCMFFVISKNNDNLDKK